MRMQCCNGCVGIVRTNNLTTVVKQELLHLQTPYVPKLCFEIGVPLQHSEVRIMVPGFVPMHNMSVVTNERKHPETFIPTDTHQLKIASTTRDKDRQCLPTYNPVILTTDSRVNDVSPAADR